MTWNEYFAKYLSYFLTDNPDPTCAKGGHAAYADVSKNVENRRRRFKAQKWLSENFLFLNNLEL